MTDITETNPHREYFETHQRVYYKGFTAAGKAQADRVELQQHHPGHGMVRLAEFEWPRQEHDLDRLVSALDRAYAAGKAAKAQELRQALGIPESR